MSPATAREAIAATVAASAAPYGYTVSTWSSGALLVSHHGLPTVTDVFGFIAGSITAFGLLAYASRAATSGSAAFIDLDRTRAGALHWLAAGAAVTSAALLAPFPEPAAWPLTAFASTTAYLLGAATQLATAAALRRRRATVAAPVPHIPPTTHQPEPANHVPQPRPVGAQPRLSQSLSQRAHEHL